MVFLFMLYCVEEPKSPWFAFYLARCDSAFLTLVCSILTMSLMRPIMVEDNKIFFVIIIIIIVCTWCMIFEPVQFVP